VALPWDPKTGSRAHRDPVFVSAAASARRPTLYGVLAQIEALGLELLEVRRLPPA